jgi:hypothetical protein
MDKKNIKKVNIILRYIIMALSSFLAIRYSSNIKINNDELLCIVSIITIILLLLDMFLPIIN